MRMRYSRSLPFLAVFSILILSGSVALAAGTLTSVPEPSIDDATLRSMEAVATGGFIAGKTPPTPFGTPGLTGAAIEAFDFDDNIPLTGSVFIPPDPHNAVGLTHVVNVVNVGIEWRPKANPQDAPQYQNSLQNFFAGTPGTLGTFTFDPKVIYDQYSDRFIVVTLERVTSPALDSRILIAVSKTSDPNAGWWRHSINSLVNIGGLNRWADYPGFAVDDHAVYVCANMFSAAGAFGGVRLWIIAKPPTYAGPDGSIVSAIYDPYGLSGQPGLATTTQPTHMYGPEPANVGTFLVSYSGLSDGVNEYVDVIRVDNPIAAPVFTFQQLLVGNFDNTGLAMPDAPQLGSARLIETNDRRALNAVWRNNNLYMCATSVGVVAPNTGQATAHWFRVSTVNLGALFVADHGDAGAEDLGAGTYTFFPSVMVDMCDNMAIGFSASNAGIYCGAYYAMRALGDPAGTIQNTAVLALGTDWYVRTFSNLATARNRWGDYSGLSICPADYATFWVYNEYACTRGTPTNVGGVIEDGRWCTKLGRFSICQPVAAAITSFSARYADGFVTVRSTFRSDMGVEAVNVYRAVGEGALQRVDIIYGADGSGFEYADRSVEPGGTYRYQIGVADADGEFLSPVEEVRVPKATASLGQNTPNPFNPTTLISYSLPAREHVTVSVYDASGRLVRTLVDETRGAGSHDVQWDGRDNAGTTVGSGVYFYRLTAGKFSESKKMVMLK
ncbi:MAG TPA: FlgD immunoglobulin-like domain containing protein [Candidatus Krumholzibacteria bacterium]|nr:FlgD immunoglobulin-like domain containing protein [Candidatus Krumholzibacteria bacterium]